MRGICPGSTDRLLISESTRDPFTLLTDSTHCVSYQHFFLIDIFSVIELFSWRVMLCYKRRFSSVSKSNRQRLMCLRPLGR